MMFVFEYISIEDLVWGLTATLLVIWLIIRLGGIANWLDPMAIPVFQIVLTAFLLGIRVIPLPDLLACTCFLLILTLGRGKRPRPSHQHAEAWQRLVIWLLPVSLAANAYLFAQKGFLLLQDDVGLARQEFYQGWGVVQRLNSICAVLFAVHWATALLAGRAKRLTSVLLLAWTAYLVLTLGSKSGFLLILTCIGSAQIFASRRISTRTLAVACLVVSTSVAAMFLLVYPETALASFGIRMVSFVDGPFYYFRLDNPPTATIGYSFDQLLVALRIYEGLSQPGLGYAINLEYFSIADELFGPNPQIFVEARAIAGALWPMYYVALVILVLSMIRYARSAYGYALVVTVAGPLIIDSQFALSNLVNVTLAVILRSIVVRIPVGRLHHA